MHTRKSGREARTGTRLASRAVIFLAVSADSIPSGIAMVDKLSRFGQSPTFLRIALGIVYFHFGILKFFPDLSPAEMLASQTIMSLSWQWLDAHSALRVLAIFECAIGAGLLLNVFMRTTFVLFLLHMIGTFLPLYYLPEYAFKVSPLAPTLEGQYILKNIVFVAAGWTVLMPNVLPRKASPEAIA